MMSKLSNRVKVQNENNITKCPAISSVRYIARENCYLHNGQRKFDDSGNAPERD